VAVVGTGVIGRSWIQVFARAGCRVRAYDADPDQLASALAWLKQDLKDLRRGEKLKKKGAKAIWKRVTACGSLKEALEGAGWVQESGPEDLALKRSLVAELDQAAGPDSIIGSSTSALDMTEIAQGLSGARRCLVAHPVNPPHVIPVVEVLGGLETDFAAVRDAVRFLDSVGQTPVLMKKFAPGFLLNRMESALVREAVDLVATGVADVDAVDAVIRDGLGLRWALMGPFGVATANADGGIREYFTRFRAAYHGLWDALRTDTRFSDELVERLGQETDAMTDGASLAEQRTWRDRMVTAIREIKVRRPLLSAEDKKKKAKRDRKKAVKVEEPQPEQEIVAAVEPKAKPHRRHGKKARRERRRK